jgi:hypothetical protein
MSFFVSIAILGLIIGFFLLVAIFSAADESTPRVASRRMPRADAGETPETEGAPGSE